ncbi:glycosyltransferase [Aquibacillus sp. 3ASR75-11]|uniref:Glycosyltransferase n=1 Tax=Terrihalobacillus insolitus TaxID=2950438 RepID=A0A9X3WUT7_9BACI|nr:glycosyltransferase [Terrihalobacillus insolitus]MDC3411823.1 glycosyltransferase [Terrihalobacillus insolitus]MDC3424998.1 glycosyltransferase [Terrihalobacillus insolitus]
MLTDRTVEPLIYADVDLNFIDGSAVWVTSIVETLSQNENIKPTLLLKSPNKRGILLNQLIEKENVNIIDPWDEENRKKFSHLFNKEQKGQRLQPEEACKIVDLLDQENNYDFFVVRGYKLSQLISQNYTFSYRTWFYLTDFPQDTESLTDKDIRNLKIIYKNSSCLACQTPVLVNYFKDLLQEEFIEEEKFVYLPPMIPNITEHNYSFSNKNNRLIYAGKFAPYWKIPDMFLLFNEIRNDQLEFVVIGDKFHNFPYTENYPDKVTDILNGSNRIKWKKALHRNEVQEEIQKSDLGISWRDKELDDSKEISTKVLEYGLHGKPVIMNRNKLHEDVFGVEYPLFANSEEEFKEKVEAAFSNPEVYKQAAEKVFEVSQRHTFQSVSKYLEPTIREKISQNEKHKNMQTRVFDKTNIVFAGHDLKFAKILIDYFDSSEDFNVKMDQWNGHNTHDEQYSKDCLAWADVIVAEWGLGNAVWYSNNKNDDQTMIVRMHLQEKDTDYPKEVKWDAVAKIVFIAPKLKEEMLDTFEFLDEDKTKIIYNLVDTNRLSKPNLPNSRFNIGIQGIVPSRKRLDIAIDIFKELWKKDHRYTLFIKGKLPNEYKWLWARDEEKNYYLKTFHEMNTSEFGNAIVYEGWGDVSEWYPKLGFVLSVSDFESFHLSVAEGMASRTVPVIRNWSGATELYPDKYIFTDVQEAISLIQSYEKTTDEDFDIETNELRDFIVKYYDKDVICKQWQSLINKLTRERKT